MACNESIRPVCSNVSPDVVPSPLTELGSIIGIISLIIGIISNIGKVKAFIISLGAFSAGALAGIIVAAGLLTLMTLYLFDTCDSVDGLKECVAGVVHEVVGDFSTTTEQLLPFTAMHDRVDVIVKSKYWNVVEDANAFVFCTGEAVPRRSEIIRCYFYTNRVCNAIQGAIIGGYVGAIGGIIAGAFAAAAIGCVATAFLLCLLALLVAALIVAAAVLVGSFIGGQIGKAASDDDVPTDDEGDVISIGELITIIDGNMVRRERDSGANVFWWVNESAVSGDAPSSIPSNPYSYCEIDEVFPDDACQEPIIVD